MTEKPTSEEPFASSPAENSEAEAPPEEQEMSFLDHLEELRSRIIRIVIVLGFGAVGGYLLSDRLLQIIIKPVGKLYFFSPPEAFLVRLKVALVASLIFILPYAFYELWRFVSPGLTPKEKRAARPILLTALILFYVGAAFALFLALPIGVKVLLSFGGTTMEGLFNATGYVNFVLILLLAFGGLFQFPVVMVFLTQIGLIDPDTLRKYRREVIVGVFVIAAIITPSLDFVTQTLLAVPLIILFELGLFASKFVSKKGR